MLNLRHNALPNECPHPVTMIEFVGGQTQFRCKHCGKGVVIEAFQLPRIVIKACNSLASMAEALCHAEEKIEKLEARIQSMQVDVSRNSLHNTIIGGPQNS